MLRLTDRAWRHGIHARFIVTALLILVAIPILAAGCRKKRDDDSSAGNTRSSSSGGGGVTGGGGKVPAPLPLTVQLTATPDLVTEGATATVTLTAVFPGALPTSVTWLQKSGPTTAVVTAGGETGATRTAVVDLRGAEVAADGDFVFSVVADDGGRSVEASVKVGLQSLTMENALAPDIQIGGATTDVIRAMFGDEEWAIYHVANRLMLTPATAAPEPAVMLPLRGFIRDIELVSYDGGVFALLAMGTEGIAVVALDDPGAPVHVHSVNVGHVLTGVAWADGGGNISLDNTVSSLAAPVASIVSDGVDVWIANEGYGIQRTALANLVGPEAPVLKPDGTLWMDVEAPTVQYAGENPWGGPVDLLLHGGRVFAALAFLGMGIYDGATLEVVGRYNLYTDVSVLEDWYVDMDVSTEVQPGFLDAETGMPDYRQAAFEIKEVWHGDTVAPAPWANFDRYGKYYYNSRAIDVADFGEGTIAFIAYGLGGLVAVDVTGFLNPPTEDGFAPSLLAILPAIPAHGPENLSGSESRSLFPHFGSGRLKEAGYTAVRIRGTRAYASDHFGGLIIVSGADDPAANWHGPDAPYNNDNPDLGEGILGDHSPSFEFVTAIDMTPLNPLEEESMPVGFYQPPFLLTTGELFGHAAGIALAPELAEASAGEVDVLQAAGAGGLNFVDLVDLEAPLVEERFALLRNIPTTDEVGAAADGSPTQPISMGHADGVTATQDYLYVADGPHGVLAWRIASSGVPGFPKLVGNSLQSETPVTIDGQVVYPAPHAHGLKVDPETGHLLVLCRTAGLRRVAIADIEAGLHGPGNPLLLAIARSDIYEHKFAEIGHPLVKKQDHAYDAALLGSYAFVADGRNGVTIYDLTKDPSDILGDFLVANLGGSGKVPMMVQASAIRFWNEPGTGRQFAFLSAGASGVAVVETTDPLQMRLVKVFEPIKIEAAEEGEEPHVGKADARAVDVFVDAGHAWFSYDSFGVVCYAAEDLVAPLPDGVDPTEIWRKNAFDYRPVAVSQFKLSAVPGYEAVGGGALKMAANIAAGRRVLFVAWGEAGLVRLDATDPAAPVFDGLAPTVGECSAVAISGGRLYVGDGAGGLAVFK
ncbi:MAG: hypothetical protein IT452_07160 [Planctomycetia bacterium]|nr:hypothetical protein [Planctomycetia bacterium]